ncbi:MAG: hypothetical protein E2576_02635 [Alcaligenaceae bacterium]|nr:hypothetical protein [Alcaligenaceae bacterium SAGV5]MPS55003.1 hypothetical protein [Alcaligenaceae bacterium SAGV3]MPT55597.1 hypothetical protein [Alcaligenaceae bacterium]
MSGNNNPVIQSIRHMTQRFDDLGQRFDDFSRRQADGEHPDPAEFIELLKKKSVTHSALSAQFGLLQKPLKTVLNETR